MLSVFSCGGNGTIELILENCANKDSIIKLMHSVDVSCITLKKYLFYLIDYGLISYERKEGIFVREESLELLFMINNGMKSHNNHNIMN